ncbi:Enoyl-[acyl-carrier-protein] reductase [FMN] [[Actinomadura] parvosata subsp. kistnae]|uniref:Oxidoreductase n=1 Tax=[Actinomadura] parvosata subsp. kistnae TaxID=1909395 RepID=A0A1U9ZTI1_9ACTN|nr:nitronate monooxygenase [Nonomuraea sp. ATCC 55076]AQZ61243.1 oxidoreductase [Nonomuraea sp. ATCC 55076]SPL97883.1 Enoyl-[acyl-carrier-protein] reductase [FMN] [Actinomadura parvosata subsp. kistnae]
MPRTWLTDRFGLDVPLVGAPMAGVADGRLAAAVSAAGALGMFGVPAAAPAPWITEQAAVAAAGGRPYGIGLMAWALAGNPAQLDAVLEARPALVSVSFGDFAPYVEPLRRAGITVAVQAGTTREAKEAERAGADVVVARGGEGGGHGRDEVATLPLLQSVLEEVRVPVLAAGGIATARGLAAVLAAGAQGGWAGTAFLGCAETTLPAAARARVLAADETGTAYGRVFDVAQRLAWPPEFGGRGLRNAFFERWHGREDELAGDETAQAELETARASGDFDTAYVYAGQAVGMVRGAVTDAVTGAVTGAGERLPTAADVVQGFAAADALLRRFSDDR